MWVTLLAHVDHEELRSPRAIRLALSGPVRTFPRMLPLLVALLYGADIAAVYPLLKILFYNENCQKWMAQEIVVQETEIRKLDARIAEGEFILKFDNPQDPSLRNHFTELHNKKVALQQQIDSLEEQLEDPASLDPLKDRRTEARVRCEALRLDLTVSEASIDELNRYKEERVARPSSRPLDGRRATLEKERRRRRPGSAAITEPSRTSTATCPHDGFQTLLLLLAPGHGRASPSRGSSCSSRKCWSPTSCS